MSDFTPEQEKAIEQIQKLLNLSAKNPNEAEAAAAASKANELLIKYNLDAAMIEMNSGGSGRREKLNVNGGFYSFQRELWYAIAQLNFCLYQTQQYRSSDFRYVDDYTGAKSMKPGEGKTRQKVDVIKFRHFLVGRVVNTKTTIGMAQYLAGAVERVLDDRLSASNRDDVTKTSNWAMSFRKGATARVIEMVEDKRAEHLKAERDTARAAERAASGASTATGISLNVYIDKETDANNDFINGEGWSAGQAAQRAAFAAERAKRQAEHAAWAKANPEEAAAKEKKREEEYQALVKKSRYRGGSSPRDNTDRSAYYSGYDSAKAISIDQQVDKNARASARIGRA